MLLLSCLHFITLVQYIFQQSKNDSPQNIVNKDTEGVFLCWADSLMSCHDQAITYLTGVWALIHSHTVIHLFMYKVTVLSTLI